MNITYLTDPVKDYSRAIDQAVTVQDLRAAITPFKFIADDAYCLAQQLTQQEFEVIRKAIRSERNGKWCGDVYGEAVAEQAAILIMPDLIFKVSAVAMQYNVPWGLAYIRLRDVGKIQETQTRATCMGL